MIRHYPQQYRTEIEFIRSFSPKGSPTRVRAVDLSSGGIPTPVLMLKWGREIYLPVYNGMKPGIVVRNNRQVWIAIPSYIERVNTWDGGPSEPEDCTPDFMWECPPKDEVTISHFVNPNYPEGRPFIITETGFGNTAGEAVFSTTEYRGEFHLYERLQLGAGPQQRRNANEGTVVPATTDFYIEEGLECLGGTVRKSPVARDAGTDKTIGGLVDDPNVGRAGFGAGEVERVNHVHTGVEYNYQAEPILALNVEYREDLLDMLKRAWSWWDGSWTYVLPSSWWNDRWTWGPPRRSSPVSRIPVITPHRGRRG